MNLNIFRDIVFEHLINIY